MELPKNKFDLNLQYVWHIIHNLPVILHIRIPVDYDINLSYLPAKERYEQLLREQPDVIHRAQLGYIASFLGMKCRSLDPEHNNVPRIPSRQIIFVKKLMC